MSILSASVLLAAAVCSNADLGRGLGDLATPAQGHVGAAARIVETGGRVALNGSDRFPMQSVYKLAIDFAVLQRVDAGRMTLDGKVRVEASDLPPAGVFSPIRNRHPEGGFEMTLEELLRAAIVDSDGTACDVLLRLMPAAEVTAALRSIGVEGMVVATTEAEMTRGPEVQYRNWATPNATLDLLAALQAGRGISAASRERLLRWMTESVPGPARLKGELPAGAAAAVAHKTGTSGTHDGLTRATNDAGILTLPDGRHVLIAVYVSDSPATLSVREGVIAKIARAVWDCWASPKPSPKPAR
jgi:beta-lactamase class A